MIKGILDAGYDSLDGQMKLDASLSTSKGKLFFDEIDVISTALFFVLLFGVTLKLNIDLVEQYGLIMSLIFPCLLRRKFYGAPRLGRQKVDQQSKLIGWCALLVNALSFIFCLYAIAFALLASSDQSMIFNTYERVQLSEELESQLTATGVSPPEGVMILSQRERNLELLALTRVEENFKRDIRSLIFSFTISVSLGLLGVWLIRRRYEK